MGRNWIFLQKACAWVTLKGFQIVWSWQEFFNFYQENWSLCIFLHVSIQKCVLKLLKYQAVRILVSLSSGIFPCISLIHFYSLFFPVSFDIILSVMQFQKQCLIFLEFGVFWFCLFVGGFFCLLFVKLSPSS